MPTGFPPPSGSAPDEDLTHLARRAGELRQGLAAASPLQLADHTGASYDPDAAEFRLAVFGQEHRLPFPGLVAVEAGSGQVAPVAIQALLMYYFQTADGAPLEGRWVSFADLPDGRFYAPAFQGYTGQRILQIFGQELEALAEAAGALGAQPLALGSAAWAFQALPRLPVGLVYWQGDEDFSSTCQVLFDASLSHYLPTDVAAFVGSLLTRRLAARRPNP